MRIVAVVACVACGKHDPAPAPPTQPPPAPTVAPAPAPPALDAAVTADPPSSADADPIATAVRAAFAGKEPPLPMVAADGKHVAVDLGVGRGMGTWRTYVYGWYAAGGKLEDTITLIDPKTADAGVPPPAALLGAVADQINGKLAGYVAFPVHLARDQLNVGDAGPDEVNRGAVKIGATRLTIVETDTDGATVTWTGKKGATLATAHVPVRPREPKEGGRCGGRPKLEDAWVDERHGRLVLSFLFPGHDSCIDEPLDWHVF